MNKKILYLTDFDSHGSGYKGLSISLCEGLAKTYEVKILGLNYRGEPHNFNFSVIPTGNMLDAHAMIHNLNQIWKFDILIVALDIPLQLFFLEKLKADGIKYVAITPLENPPLTMTWAAGLMQANFVFFISELASQAADDAGLKTSAHLNIGIDNESWRVPSDNEKTMIRQSLGIDDKFVVLSVCENQERKNPWALLDIISKVKYDYGISNLKFIWVTSEHTPVGITPSDMAIKMGIVPELMIVEKGIPFKDLLTLYFSADVFLLTSKAEGLGLPILEAMSCGLPVVASETGAIVELLLDGRGFLVPPEYSFIDVWGNSKRDMINRDLAARTLSEIYSNVLDTQTAIKSAREYVSQRVWDIPVAQLENKIEEICNVSDKNN